jgi:hypothetical protein
MKRFIAWIKSLWRSFRRRDHISKVVQVESRADLPRNLGAALYIVGQTPKWAVLKCPCGCGEVIDVNLMQARHPSWTLSFRDGKVTLLPSLWVPEERCGSHFWIRDSKIDWV